MKPFATTVTENTNTFTKNPWALPTPVNNTFGTFPEEVFVSRMLQECFSTYIWAMKMMLNITNTAAYTVSHFSSHFSTTFITLFFIRVYQYTTVACETGISCRYILNVKYLKTSISWNGVMLNILNPTILHKINIIILTVSII